MTENREQSQAEDWDLDLDRTVAADELGPFRLVATADFTEGDDGYVDIQGNVRVVVTNTDDGAVVLDQEFEPVLWGQGFTTLDHDSWKVAAESAIQAAGYDLDAILAAARGNAA